jgi:RHS repeat-associated protein
MGATVQLAMDGSFQMKVTGSTAPIDVTVDVLGYYTASDGSAGAFTAASVRVYDSRVTPNVSIPASSVATVPVAGVNGVPLAGSGISAIAINMHSVTYAGGGAGLLRAWASDRSEPAVSAVTFPAGQSVRNALVVVQPGADGKIRIRNTASTATDVVLDVAGWYSQASPAVSSGQMITSRYLLLQAIAATGSGSWVTYRYRVGSSGDFMDVPVVGVTPQGGAGHPSGWPVSKNGSGTFDAYVWDTSGALSSPGAIQVLACYGSSATDTNPICSMPTAVQVDPAGFQSAYSVTMVGPGALSELTGDYMVSISDVQQDAFQDLLSVGRTLTTLSPAGERDDASGVFGPGWTANLQSDGSGHASLRLRYDTVTGYLTFTASDGSSSVYQPVGSSSSYPVQFVGVGDAAADGTQVTQTAARLITMRDVDGTLTSWTRSGGNVWSVANVSEPGSSTSTRFVYDSNGLPTRVIGPAPDGATCSSPYTAAGCRSLFLEYTTVVVGGKSESRLSKVSLTAYDPVTGSSTTTAVAVYSYDGNGRLYQERDPRITPALYTTYSYDTDGRLVTMSPPGQATWTLDYDIKGRLLRVTRPSPAGGTATWTVVYDVPVTGSGAPVDVGATAAASWGQTNDIAVSGVAVFGPNRLPAGTTTPTVTSSDWPYASIDYLDVNGRVVNTAGYGAGAWQIDGIQYDNYGNAVWLLSPGNRAQALSTTSYTDTAVATMSGSAVRANLLATTTSFDPLHPGRATDTLGPVHPVALADGTVIHARTHQQIDYDQGAPDDGTDYGLPTTETLSARDLDGTDHAATIRRYGYDAIETGDRTGWSLFQATSQTVQLEATPSTDDLTTITRYDSAGRVIETRSPGGASGGTAQSTLTAYYTATGTGSCVSTFLAGRVCTTGPAVQPASGPPLPITLYTYDKYGNVLTATETAGTTLRTTSYAYDTAGRLTSRGISVMPSAAGGTALPVVTYSYDTTTGLPTTQTAGGQTLTVGYDNLGEVTNYTDATGNTATYTYDLAGRLTSMNDGKGTTTISYDTTGEHRNVPTSESVGVAGASTFTATYNADGQLESQAYPNGLAAWTHYDNTGQPSSLVYAKGSTTWLSFLADYDPAGRIATQQGSGGAQRFTYDGAGRLTQVQDTIVTSATTAECTTRGYTFDRDSNRTSLAVSPDADGGATATGRCALASSPTVKASTFDQADRTTNTGYAYDTCGRTTTIPAADAISIGSKAGIAGNLTVGYYANDMIAAQYQGTATRSYTLDPTQERNGSVSDGTVTVTDHYTDDSDAPAWTSCGTKWTRNLHGIDGAFSGTETDTGTVTWQLANLHGDIIATVDNNSVASSPNAQFDTTEYGQQRDPANAPDTYGYLGTTQRSVDTLGGLILMGARLYSPVTGRFLSVDPIPGGNANPYVYPTDPINQSDGTGRFCWSWIMVFCGASPVVVANLISIGRRFAGVTSWIGRFVAGAMRAGRTVITGLYRAGSYFLHVVMVNYLGKFLSGFAAVTACQGVVNAAIQRNRTGMLIGAVGCVGAIVIFFLTK